MLINMSTDYEIARKNLEDLVEWYKTKEGGRNEASTRFHIIDELFFKCLGWSKDEMIPEEHHNKEYADYTFLAPRKVLIVEAKKEGDYFQLPATNKEKIEYSITTLFREYPSLKAAINQAINYCHDRGVPFGAVSNGHQLVAFIATRSDGIPPTEGKALVFSSLDSMLEHFIELWNALSKSGIEQKILQKRLLGVSLPELPSKLSSTIYSYPGLKSRNPFQAEMQTLSELVIEDIPRASELRKEFLSECYSNSGALSQYALVSKNILQTKYASIFNTDVSVPTTIPAVDKNGLSPSIIAEGLSRRPIILIGDVGVGKSEFINNLIHNEAKNVFENSITIYLNLGTKANFTRNLNIFLLDEITRQLLTEYDVDIDEQKLVRTIYNADLNRFKKGIYSGIKETNPSLYQQKELELLESKINNREEHIKQVLLHLSVNRNKQIVIFIDNADQRDDETQQQAFLISQEIAENWKPVTVFVSLRPETFYRSLKIGALSGYHPKAFTISPPRADNVIIKRLKFALKLTSGKIPIPYLSENIELQLHNIGQLITIFLDSIERSDDIIEFIDNVAGDNIRLALDLVRSFFGSGHVDTDKFLEKYYQTGSYFIPIHEFLRAMIFGDAEYYDPNQSLISNLFDISTIDPKEHFLLPVILGYLNKESISSEEGFVKTSLVYEKMQGFGFTPEQIDFAVIRSHKKHLIETSSRIIPHPDLGMPQAIRITSVGSYHVIKLCCLFVYIDAILVDTPILDNKFRDIIKIGHNISTRLSAVDSIKQYLDKQWTSLENSGASSLFDWEDTSRLIQENINYIKLRV
jgi:GTPase SAR1 family protein